MRQSRKQTNHRRLNELHEPQRSPRAQRTACALGLTESIDYLMRVGLERVSIWNRHLADLLIEGLRRRNGAIVSSLKDGDRASIVAVRFANASATALAEHLNAARVVVSARRNVLRFSPHLYNDEEDISQALVEIDRFLNR